VGLQKRQNTKSSRLVVLAGLLLGNIAATGFAQGTVVFTWHGDSGYFHASFQVTDAEMLPGATWSSPLFLNSLAATNPLGFSYHGGDSSSAGSGGVYPNGSFWVGNDFIDFGRGAELHEGTGVMFEKPISGSITWFEGGHWTYAETPEPSSTALITLAAALWAYKSAKT
jgi:hypothetical protein